VLGVGLFAVATSLLRSPDVDEVSTLDAGIAAQATQTPSHCLTTREGEQICYSVCNRAEGRMIAGVGGLFVGMISTGLGELNGYFLLRRCRVPSRVAVATSVYVVALTALSASAGHAMHFLRAGPDTLALVGSIAVFTIPGVVVGAQLGARLSSRIPQHTLERGLGVLFELVAVVTLGEVALAG